VGVVGGWGGGGGGGRGGGAQTPGIPYFHSLVCVDNNIQKWKSGNKLGRPRRIRHASYIRLMRGGRGGAGLIVDSASLQSLHRPVD